jgi:adenylyltransferase/sulfurtransferase
MTNSMNIYKFASWKHNCPAHEKWENIRGGKNLSATMKVRELFSELKTLLGVKALEINMRNNKFIDKIVSDNPEKEYEVMLPESKPDDYINSNAELRKLSYRTLFHKSYFEIIESDFPYQELSLQELGIPLYDVIEVPTDKGLFYVELSGDAQLYA